MQHAATTSRTTASTPSRRPTGHKGQKGDRNSPTVFNAAGHFAQFWDGRAPDVEAQAKGPVLNPVEMAMPAEQTVVAVLKSMPEYVDLFKKAFPGDKRPVTYDNMAKAIGAFERKLVTPSRWDTLLKGDADRADARGEGGPQDVPRHRLPGLPQRRAARRHVVPEAGRRRRRTRALDDPGRFKVTKAEADKGVFKVPSLRNVEKTGPYFHDGKVASLDQAVRDMAEYQLGKTLTDDAGEADRHVPEGADGQGSIPEYIKPPVLPKSTAKTPKPDIS